MTTTLNETLKAATEPCVEVAIPLAVLRNHFEERATRRSVIATAKFLLLMGAAVLVMNLEHVLVGAPRLLNLAIVLFVLVAFPLAWLIHRRHCKRLPIKKRFQWAGRVEACNRVAIGGWVAAMGWIALGHSGILPVPTVESMLPWTIVTVPLIAWLLGVVAKLIAKRFDPDWWE